MLSALATIAIGIMGVFLSVIILSMFQYYTGMFAFFVGKVFGFIQYPIKLIDKILYPVSDWVYVLYSSAIIIIIIVLVYKLIVKNK